MPIQVTTLPSHYQLHFRTGGYIAGNVSGIHSEFFGHEMISSLTHQPVAKNATTSLPLRVEANGTIGAIPETAEKVAILNFANEFMVAGGYRLAGRKTQEAALCR